MFKHAHRKLISIVFAAVLTSPLASWGPFGEHLDRTAAATGKVFAV
jgi:hypothetical protein